MNTLQKFKKLREILGDKVVLDDILNFFPTAALNDFIDSVISDHGIEEEFQKQ